MKTIIPSLLLLFSVLSITQAAMLLADIQRYQQAAPEQLEIEVTKAKKKAVKEDGSHLYRITATATVTVVIKSASGVKAGEVIQFNYTVPNFDKGDWAGDFPGVIEKGKSYTAYIKKSGTDKPGYEPAAFSGSFEPLTANKKAAQ